MEQTNMQQPQTIEDDTQQGNFSDEDNIDADIANELCKALMYDKEVAAELTNLVNRAPRKEEALAIFAVKLLTNVRAKMKGAGMNPNDSIWAAQYGVLDELLADLAEATELFQIDVDADWVLVKDLCIKHMGDLSKREQEGPMHGGAEDTSAMGGQLDASIQQGQQRRI